MHARACGRHQAFKNIRQLHSLLKKDFRMSRLTELSGDMLDLLLDHTGLAGAAALRATCRAMSLHRPDRFRRLRQCAAPCGAFWAIRLVEQPADVIQWAYALRLPLRSLCPDPRCQAEPWRWLCWEAAVGRRQSALDWAASSGLLQQSTAACDGAADRGDVPLLAWLRARHAPAGCESLLAAGRRLHLKTLEWLLDEGGVKWCPTVATEMAREACTCPVVLWAIRRGLPVELQQCGLRAAVADQWDLVRVLHEDHRMPLHRGLLLTACQQGREPQVQWLLLTGCPGADDAAPLLGVAAFNGHVSVLRALLHTTGLLAPQQAIDLIHCALSGGRVAAADYLAWIHHS